MSRDRRDCCTRRRPPCHRQPSRQTAGSEQCLPATTYRITTRCPQTETLESTPRHKEERTRRPLLLHM